MFRIPQSRVHINPTEIVRIYAETEKEAGAAISEEEDADDSAQSPAETEESVESIPESVKAVTEKAESEARELIFRAELEAVKLKAAAEDAGYKEGAVRAEEEYALLLTENKASLRRLVEEIEAGRARMLEGMESEIIDLCLAIVRKIADADRTKDGELFRAAIQKALGRMNSESGITIRVSNADFERFFPDGEASFDTADGRVSAVIAGNPDLAEGDVIIDAEDESIKAGVNSQIKNIELRFRQRLGNGNEYD